MRIIKIMRLIILLLLFVFAFSEETAARTANDIVDRLGMREAVFSLSNRVGSFHQIFGLDPDMLSSEEKTALGFISGFMMAQVDKGRS